MGHGWDKAYEMIDGVAIYRYPEPKEAHSGAVAYAREYLSSLWHWFRLAPEGAGASGGLTSSRAATRRI